MSSVQLYCAWFCPFAQRAWIALLHKGVDFEYIEQDPYDKSPEWLKVSPRGLVPSIIHHGKPIYESSVCIEYVDEAWPDNNPLLPKDPYERAQARIWADQITKKVVPPFYAILLKETQEEREASRTELLTHVAALSQAMSKEGPYFMGKQFGLVDIMLFPHALRFDHILAEYRNFKIPQEPQFERFHRWLEAVKNVNSVKATIQLREKLVEKYRRYAENYAETEVADAIRKGKTLP